MYRIVCLEGGRQVAGTLRKLPTGYWEIVFKKDFSHYIGWCSFEGSFGACVNILGLLFEGKIEKIKSDES